ncbi:ABC transporter ATP-binding protein [Anaerosalibacter bizertensis]|uniref:ABC transporter ATP-binding protein n=1 Tax=Anaerosalibacter bizertensis TaxID=932217 RepID=A0A9Q4FMJ4_9FIRM|nr:ABC transporter ATP-binding protein [Anaerosalibacter bizertensis]MBV1818957.1 ABC transporter ATP-binding protein [Bacteroidales bacterium MSK.15.36]MBU5294204.1 ABC transporter ATP-binding protein [Anaerosalibacter bizertensis]MBU5294208.1 ABC transporter ATP-binding protein [Anaerosalibacter bizertensis]MCB5559952.1 ABC transporter ATP-binding protein [Anaerosalibacter bizertensis]MCG4565795.1 ABC transporter ATP-binding protein [Anaerosalibacter bizertensis]
MSIIKLENLHKVYGKDNYKTVALKDINLSIEDGELVSIMGPSGSGKSTLLNIIGCLDTQTKGEYTLEGRKIIGLSNKEMSKIRNTTLSFVFQNFALLKDYTVYENIELPLLYRNMKKSKKKEKIYYYMDKLGIRDLEKKKPKHISGGQQQRVAIARALVGEAKIILADEPTGALDQKTGKELLDLLISLNTEGKTIIIVTHDVNVANMTNRLIKLEDGKIIGDNKVINGKVME